MSAPTVEQCEAIIEAAREANYWSTPDPYLIIAIWLLMIGWLIWAWVRPVATDRQEAPGER